MIFPTATKRLMHKRWPRRVLIALSAAIASSVALMPTAAQAQPSGLHGLEHAGLLALPSSGGIPLTSGWYKFENADYLGYCLDLADSNVYNGDLVDLWSCNGSAQNDQYWYYDSNSHLITPKDNQGYCLDAGYPATFDRQLDVWTYNGSRCYTGNNEAWYVTYNSDSTVEISLSSYNPVYCVDIRYMAYNGDPATNGSCSDNDTRWYPVSTPFRLTDTQTGACLDSDWNGNAYTNPCWYPDAYQNWFATVVSSGYRTSTLTVMSLQTNRCLDSNSSGNVYTNPCWVGDTNQEWVTGSANDWVVNRATGRCLDSNYNHNLYTLPCNGSTYQSWGFAAP